MLIAVALCFLGKEVQAQWMDGNKLHEYCEEQRSPNKLFCGGFILGVLQVGQNAFCPPPGVTWEQGEDIAAKYLRDHPETRHLPADTLIITALKEKFPCN
jgi:hypothetical protein